MESDVSIFLCHENRNESFQQNFGAYLPTYTSSRSTKHLYGELYLRKIHNEFYIVYYPNWKFKYNHKLVKGKTLLSSKERNNSRGFVEI